MKKIVLSLMLFLAVFLVSSCNNNPPSKTIDNTDALPNNVADEIEKPEIDATKNNEEIQEVEEIKPSTVEEIIEYANGLNVDTSMTQFSLSGVLTSAQIPESEDAGDEYQNETAYLGDIVSRDPFAVIG